MKKIISMLTATSLLFTPISISIAAAAPDTSNITTFNTDASEVAEFSDGYAAYYAANGLCGFIRYDGRIMSQAIYQSVKPYSQSLWPVQTEHGWQFVNMDGTTAIAGPFDSAESFRFGISVVSAGGKYGAISASGEYVIEPAWDFISEYDVRGYACALLNDQWSVIDAAGNVVTTRYYDELIDFGEKAIVGRYGSNYDVLLDGGNVAQTFTAEEVGGAMGDYITYRTGDTWQLRTLEGETVWTAFIENADNYECMLPPVNGMVKYDINDTSKLYDLANGAWLGDESWAYAQYPSDGMIRVRLTDGTYAFSDMSGQLIGDKRFANASDFHYGVAAAFDGQKWTIIDKQLKEVGTLNGELNAEFVNDGFTNGYVITDAEAGEEITRIPGSAIEGGAFEVINGAVTEYRGEGGDVRIPEGVTAIGDGVFAGMENIISVSFPESLTKIGAKAFDSCTNLAGRVYIPASVTEIGERAFDGTQVSYFEVAGENAMYLSWEGGLATLDGTFLRYPAGSLEQYYSLPYNTAKLADYAFSGCENLKYVNVPYDVAERLDISKRAFDADANLYLICNKDSRAAEQAMNRDIQLLTVYETPAPTAEPTATPEPTAIPGKVMVFFNPGGKYYHTKSDCSGMKNAGYYTLEDAIAQGKQRCPVCNPPEPTPEPTVMPTEAPEVTDQPAAETTPAPTAIPTEAPTVEPTTIPTEAPTEQPTAAPTEAPTEEPTIVPTEAPTQEPTQEPTVETTETPDEPTLDPGAQEQPLMFGAEDTFADTLSVGVSTREQVEELLEGETLSDEYQEDGGIIGGMYSFGNVKYNADGVLIYIELNENRDINTVRGIKMGAGVSEVMALFANTNALDGTASGVIYEDEAGNKAEISVVSGKPVILSYQYMVDDQNIMVLSFMFVKDKMMCATQYAMTLEQYQAQQAVTDDDAADAESVG